MRGTVVRLTAFVAICLLFTGWLAATIGNVTLANAFGRNTYSLRAAFDDVTGLLPNDTVKVAGVPVGKVTAIRVDKGRAVVELRVRKETRLPSDTSATIRWRNLLGQRYLYLEPGEASTVLEDGDRIDDTRSVIDIGELFNRLGPIVQAVEPAKVNEFLVAVTDALDGNEAALQSALADLTTLLEAIADRDLALGRMVENLDTVAGVITTRDAQLRAILDDLVAVSATFSEHADVVDRAITDVGTLSSRLAPLLEGNRAQIDSLLANLTVLIRVVADKLPTLDSTVANLDGAAAALFRSASYGEWLNQEILCARIGYPAASSVATECTADSAKPATAADPTQPARLTGKAKGADAIRQLLVTAPRLAGAGR